MYCSPAWDHQILNQLDTPSFFCREPFMSLHHLADKVQIWALGIFHMPVAMLLFQPWLSVTSESSTCARLAPGHLHTHQLLCRSAHAALLPLISDLYYPVSQISLLPWPSPAVPGFHRFFYRLSHSTQPQHPSVSTDTAHHAFFFASFLSSSPKARIFFLYSCPLYLSPTTMHSTYHT